MIAATPGKNRLDSFVFKPCTPGTCKKCGGKLARDYEDIACINCGALHDKTGKIASRTWN